MMPCRRLGPSHLIMDPVVLVEELTDEERALLVEALRALRRARGQAWFKACDAAEVANLPRPSLTPYGIKAIEQLARRLGGSAPHWLDE